MYVMPRAEMLINKNQRAGYCRHGFKITKTQQKPIYELNGVPIGSGGNVLGDEFDYIMKIGEELEAGKWIAVVDRDIVVGDTAKEVFDKIKQRHPKNEPLIMKVPDNSNMLL